MNFLISLALEKSGKIERRNFSPHRGIVLTFYHPPLLSLLLHHSSASSAPSRSFHFLDILSNIWTTCRWSFKVSEIEQFWFHSDSSFVCLMYNNALNAETSNLGTLLSWHRRTSHLVQDQPLWCYGYCNCFASTPSSSLQILLLPKLYFQSQPNSIRQSHPSPHTK